MKENTVNPNIVTANFCPYDREIDVLHPDTWEPKLEDVFRALPKINRFNGQTNEPYSVARHSINCVRAAKMFYKLTKPHLLLALLLHDAAEAYIGDIVRPIKYAFNGDLFKIERDISKKILNLIPFSERELADINQPYVVDGFKEIDMRMAVTEADQLLETKILPDVPRFNLRIFVEAGNSWRYDRFEFTARFEQLMLELGQAEVQR